MNISDVSENRGLWLGASESAWMNKYGTTEICSAGGRVREI